MDHNFYHRILDNVPSIVCVVYNDGDAFQIVYGNNMFYSSMISKDEIANHRSFTQELIHEDDVDKFLAARSLLLHSGELSAEIGSCRSLHLIGNHKYYQSIKWTMTIKQTLKDFIILFGQPYSDKDEAKITRDNQFVDSFQNGPIPLHWLSITGHIIWANDVELETLGYTREEYLGRHILDFCPEESEKLTEVFSKLHNGETIHDSTFKFRTKTGETKFLLLDSNVMLDSEGNFRHICCFLRDVTKRHMNDRLLEIQRKSTQSLLDLKDAFLRRIFHEMKTPLHTLFSHLKQFSTDLDPVSFVHLPNNHKVYQVELVSAPLAKIPPGVSNREAPQSEHIDAGQRNQQIRRICHVLENISSAQRYQEDHIFQVRPIFLHFPSIIQSLLCQAKETELKPGHHIQFRMELDETTIRTDKMIQSVFYNLLANAIRYSPTDNRPHSILLKVTSTPANPTSVSSSSSSAPSPAFVLHHFTLTNTFSPPIDLMEISQRFHTPSHSLNTDGATETIGLGLYVSSQIVQNLGGMLECHCHGSEIIVQFALSCQDVGSGDGQGDHLETVCPCLEEAVTWIPITPTLCEDLNPRNPSQLQQQPLAIRATAPPAATASPAQVSQPLHRGSKRPRLSPEPAGAGVAPREGHVDTLWNEVRPHTHLLLIVEDSTLCQKIVLKLLTSFGFRCDIANNGYEALEKLKSPPCTVDVVLMDLRMPVMDGITAITEIRKYPHLQGIPIIVTTAEVGPDIEKEVYHAGGDHFLAKPLKRMELLSALQKYIPLATLSATMQLGT